MTPHELDTFVRQHNETLRVYDWRQVERMREQVADLGAWETRLKSDLMVAEQALSRVEGVMNELRAAKMYEWSDKLRDALTGGKDE